MIIIPYHWKVSLEGSMVLTPISSHTASVNSPNLQTLTPWWKQKADHEVYPLTIQVYDTSLHQVNLITSRIVNFQKMIITIKNEYKETKDSDCSVKFIPLFFNAYCLSPLSTVG